MVASLLLLHATQHYSYHEYVVYTEPWMIAWNQSIRDVLVFLFTGKAFNIFALLFGFTFYLIYDKQVKQGGDLTWRFIWRMILLLGFGLFNVAFFAGDVLVSYAVCGVILVPLRKCSTRLLLVIAALFLLLPGEWYMYIRTLLDPQYVPFDNGYLNNYAPMKENLAKGEWLSTIWSNISLGCYASSMWKFDMGRIAQTCALFILGYAAGREQLFDASAKSQQFWVKLFCGSFIAAVVIYPFVMGMKALFITDPRMQPLRDISASWFDFSLTSITVSLFLLLYRTEAFRSLTKHLATYGKASLSNYIMQSVMGCCIFYPVGLGLAPYLNMASSALLALALIALQIVATHFYLKKFKRGPLEAIWHRLTWIGR
ncbi:MAG: DUF418 domain-containing protein [Akkermansia sp.]